MTETCAGSIYGKSCPSYELKRDLEYGCLGKCIPGINMRIVSDNGAVAGQGEVGHLQVQGNIVFEHYYNNPEATASAFSHDGWFITGDQAFVDEAGNLNLSGRAKEIFIINGVQYYPHQIESALEDANLPGVLASFFACFSHRPQGVQTERFCIVYSPIYPKHSIATRVEANMLEAGITSIDLLKMQKELQSKFSIADIPLITLLTNPTIEGMSAALDRSKGLVCGKGAVYNPVVPMSTKGTKTPLWLVHPGVGEVLVFLNLAKFITDRPVYALRAKGFEKGEGFFDNIPEIVENYCKHMRQTQPKGPYAIAGYSFGAMLAFEIFKRLEAQGEQVKFLGSLNLPPHIKTRMNQLDWIEVALNLGCFLDLYSEAYQVEISDEMHKKQPQEVLSFVMEQAPPARLAELSLTRPKMERWISLAHAMQNAARDYEPTGSVAHIDVFYCTPLASVSKDRQHWLEEYLGKWKDFSRGEPHFHEVDGAHYSMLDSQNVHSFREKLKAVLSKRGL